MRFLRIVFFDAFFFSKTWFWTKNGCFQGVLRNVHYDRHDRHVFTPQDTVFLRKTLNFTDFQNFWRKRIFWFENRPVEIDDFRLPNRYFFLFSRGDLTAISKKQWSWPWKIVNYQRIIFRKTKCVEIKNAFERIFFSGRIQN